MFTRQELQTMASWLGKIQRFNAENENKYFISFDYSPYWGTPAEIWFYKVVIEGEKFNLSRILNAEHNSFTEIGEINALLNLIVKGKVEFEKLTDSNWKEIVENSKEN